MQRKNLFSIITNQRQIKNRDLTFFLPASLASWATPFAALTRSRRSLVHRGSPARDASKVANFVGWISYTRKRVIFLGYTGRGGYGTSSLFANAA